MLAYIVQMYIAYYSNSSKYLHIMCIFESINLHIFYFDIEYFLHDFQSASLLKSIQKFASKGNNDDRHAAIWLINVKKPLRNKYNLID